MVSSTCRGSCTNMSAVHTTRKLHLDPHKDYKTPLQVETSVEYDLPSHIYPPKGSDPILMIHPAYTTPVTRNRKVVSPVNTPVTSRTLGPIQLNLQVRSASKASQNRNAQCQCGGTSCKNDNISTRIRVSSARNAQEAPVSGALSTFIFPPMVQEIQVVGDPKLQQKHIEQQNAQAQKQLRTVQQKQLKLQRQQAKLQSQHQLQHVQGKQQKEQIQPSQRTQEQPHILNWPTSNRCQYPCCLPRIGALPPPQAEFLAPGLPPSLLARTPTRGPAGGSPKLRARTRRGLSVANTMNLPEYLGTSRPSRASSVSGGTSSNHAHHRTRSSVNNSSMVSTTPVAPITAHQVASALDVVRGHNLTPKTLFPNSNTLPCAISNTSSLFTATVGQCRDSGCSMSGTEMSLGNSGPESMYSSGLSNNASSAKNSKNVEWNRTIVDSGFCTPVDVDDQIMEPLDLNISSGFNSSPYSQTSLANSSLSKESTPNTSNINWMREISSTLTPSTPLGGLAHPFLQGKNATHYIPQPIWNLAY